MWLIKKDKNDISDSYSPYEDENNSDGDEIADISRAYYDRNPEYNTLWIQEEIDSNKFVDELTQYIPINRRIREDYVKNYFSWKYGEGKRIVFINSKGGY